MISDSNEANWKTPGVKSAATEGLPTLVGRDQELAQLDAILQQCRPALVVVSGADGMGKTSLLQVAQARAREKGWHTPHGGSERTLSIEPATTEETFSQLVLELPSVSTKVSPFDAGADASDTGKENTLGDQLSGHGSGRSVLLVIDGYRPRRSFADWFTECFIADVKSTQKPMVVIVADRDSNVEALESFADKIIALGPLEPEAVRQHFEWVGQRVTPPVHPAELHVYVESTRGNPAQLAILTRVLRLEELGERNVLNIDNLASG